MPTDRASVERLMKRCQIGVGGRGALDAAHDIMAECYGTLGALLDEVERFRAENERLRQALRFYAHRCHLTLGEPNAWDIVSGEPPNYLCDEAGTATIEDGTIACMALRGVDLGDEIEELRMPIEGEPNAVVSGAPTDAKE